MLRAKTALAFALSFGAVAPATAQDLLAGDTKLSCEALLCLASMTRPGECMPSLTRYFSIQAREWTTQLRMNFLNLCPTGGDANTASLIPVLAYASGQCEINTLNNASEDGIGNSLPAVCSAFYAHPYIASQNQTPVYVGEPSLGGFWTTPAQLKEALAFYEAKLLATANAASSHSD